MGKISKKVSFPPYPKLGEGYRLLAKALDTQSVDSPKKRKLDRLAREGSFDWSVLPEVKEELIIAPLTKYFDEPFARIFDEIIVHIHELHVNLVKNVSIDALDRNAAMFLLVEKLYSAKLGESLIYLKERLGGPSLVEVLNEKNNPVHVVMLWGETFLDASSNSLESIVYPAEHDKTTRDTIAKWRRGIQLPKLASIVNLREEIKRKAPQKAGLAVMLAKWLLIARTLAFLERMASKYGSLRRLALREILSGSQEIDLGYILSRENIKHGDNNDEIRSSGLMLQQRLNLTYPKKVGDKGKAKKELENFSCLMGKYNAENIATYWLKWYTGRWHALSGDFSKALSSYVEAADLCLYRNGKDQKKILKETMVVAAKLNKRSVIKRFKNQASEFDLFLVPPGDKSDSIAGWEMEVYLSQLFMLFPERGRFHER